MYPDRLTAPVTRSRSTRWASVALLLLAVSGVVAARAAGRDLAVAHSLAAAARQLSSHSSPTSLHHLLADRSLGFRQLVLHNAAGQVVDAAGDLTPPDWAWAPWGLRELWSRLVLAWRWQQGRLPLANAQTLDYVIDPAMIHGSAHDHAVVALWSVSLGVLLVAGLMLAGNLGRGRRRRKAPLTQRRRLQPLPAAVSRSLQTVPQGESTALAPVDGVLQLLAQTGQGLLLIDPAGRVRWIDAVAQMLTGWSEVDAQGQLIFTVCHLQDDDQQQQTTPAERVLAADGPVLQRLGGWLLRRDGERSAVDCVAVRYRRGAENWALMTLQPATERRRAQQALQTRARLAEAVVRELAECVLVTDETGQVRSANARASRMFGYSAQEFTQQTIARLMPVPFMNAPDVRFTDYRATPSRRLPRVVAWRRDATHFPAELVAERLPQVDGQGGGYVVIVRDVSERLRSINLAQRLGRLLDSAMEEVYIFDAYTLYFLEVNRGAQRNLGYSLDEMLQLTPLMLSEGLDVDEFHGYLGRLRGGEVDHLVYRARQRRADGSVYPVEVRLNFSRDEEPPVFMAIATDITERQAEEQEMERLAHFDGLTGLPNRPQLYLRMRSAMVAARHGTRQLAVMFLDLDGFKAINDQHGHDVGDEVLKVAAQRMRDALRTSDMVARLSGDEFVVIAEGINGTADAELVANKLLQALNQPLQCQGHDIPLHASLGITLYPRDDADYQTLLRHADEAMYQAKRVQRGSFRFFLVERSDIASG